MVWWKDKFDKSDQGNLRKVLRNSPHGSEWLKRGVDKLGMLDVFVPKKRMTLNDGTVVTVKNIAENQRVEVFTPEVVKEEKEKRTRTEYQDMVTKEWVIILPVCEGTSPYTVLGIMVLNKNFNLIKYIPYSDDIELFSNFKIFPDQYYGFKYKWYPAQNKTYLLEELPRRSQKDLMDEDWEEVEYGSTDSGWIPGHNTVAWYDSIGGEEYGGGTIGVYIPDTAFPDPEPPCGAVVCDPSTYTIFGTDIMVYSIEVEEAQTGNPVDAPPYNKASYYDLQGTGYEVDGLTAWDSHGWPYVSSVDAYSDFENPIYWMEQWQGVWCCIMGIWTAMEDPEYPTQILSQYGSGPVYPGDGVQSRTETTVQDFNAFIWFEGGPIVKSWSDFAYEDIMESWVEGVWSNQQQTSLNATWGEGHDPWYGDCCTRPTPEKCLPQDVFGKNEKWMVYDIHYTSWTDSVTWSPCYYSDYGYNASPGLSNPDYFNGEIWFDDGYIEVMSTGDVSVWNDYDSYGYPSAWDFGIYDWHEVPIYIGHYHFPGAEHKNVVFYYYGGEFRMSEKFDNDPPYTTYAPKVNAFDCLEKYGGYWLGEVRVGSLTKTHTKERSITYEY